MNLSAPRRGVRAAALLSTLALAATGLAAGSATAAADDSPRPKALAKGLFSPLSLDVAHDGTAYYTQNFAGQLWMKKPRKEPRQIFTAKTEGTEVGAVSERRGNLAFATTEPDGDTFLYRVGNSGRAHKAANLSAYEKRVNPDGEQLYGVPTIDEECAAQFPAEGPPAVYPGIVESHPYATFQTRKATYVADAAANAVLKVDRRGRISTVAVLPGIPLEITAELAAMFGIPDCAVGHDYLFEPVPTDVERGRDGKLYVSSLPGGPEDPSLGARGSVFQVSPRSGNAKQVVTELMSPTGVAVTPSGAIFVAELFGMRIARHNPDTGRTRTFAQVELPGDVEWERGRLYATTKVLTGMSGEPGDVPDGRVVVFRR